MKEGQPYYNEQGDSIEADITFDWKASPDEIMEILEKALIKHGLVLMNHDTESDFYAFSIEKQN